MKSFIMGVILVLCIGLSGCYFSRINDVSSIEHNLQTAANTQPAQSETIVWYADLTHDGVDEKIVIDTTVFQDYSYEDKNIHVYNASGEMLWAAGAHQIHVGNIGYYLYTDDQNKEYLLEGGPYFGTGGFAYNYKVFYLDDKGQEIVQKKDGFGGNLESYFELRPEADVTGLIRFLQKANAYLRNSFILINTAPITTLEGNGNYSTPEVKSIACWEADFLYW